MLPYHQQLFYKQKQVTDNLQRIAKIDLPEMLPIAGATEIKHYRNKLEYTFATEKYISTEEFRLLKQQGIFPESVGAAGFHARGFFNKVVAIDTCHLQHEPTNLIRKAIEDFARKNNYPFYNIKQHEGWLRNMMVRMATTGEIMVNVVVGYDNKK